MEFFKTCNGIPVHISDSGEGDNVLVLLHGYLETLYIWDEFTKLLNKGFRVISIDLPGHGLSGTFPVNTMQKCAQTVLSVMDNLNIQKATIVGHSMGGYVACDAAITAPDRFNALIMINSTPFADSEEKAKNRDREISLIRQNKLQKIVKSSIANMFSPLNKSKFEEKILEISEIAEVHDPEGITSSLEGMKLRGDYSAKLSESSLPVLFFFGLQDNFISKEVSDKVMSAVPNAKYIFLEKSGHNGFLEEPHKCASIITEFSNGK